MAWLGFADSSPAQPPPPDGHEQAPRGEEAGEFMLSLLPWGISFLLHLGLVLLAVFIVWSVQKQVSEEEIIIPIARLSATPGAPLQMKQTKTLTPTRSAVSRRTLVTKTPSQTQSALAEKVSLESLSLSKSLDMGKSSPFEVGVRAGEGMKARFMGTGGNAYRIAYLVDASGSLIDTLPFVIMELKRSVSELSEKQSFTVIFFQGEEAVEVPPRGLKQATAANKQRVNQWLDEGHIVPMGQSNPIKALQIALRYKPQLLFLLSDNITGEGKYEVDQRRLLAEIEEANRSGTKINTIQFLYQDKLVDYGMLPTLEMISKESGGVYKYMDGRELGIQ